MSKVIASYDNSDMACTPKSSDVRIDVDLEDGPLFRATVKEYESRTLVLKSYLKRILKAASANLEAKTLALEQDRLFVEALKEAPFAEPLFSHYLDFTREKLYEQQERLLFCMQSLLIHPLQKLYDMDIKTVDTKKRQFEDVSKDYYTNLAKYLSIKTPNKKQQKTEAEFLLKKREFDLVRFDYYTFLRDLHGGKKGQEILYHLLNLYQKQYSFFHDVHKTLEPHKQGLDELAILSAEASREQKMVNQERDEKRKIIVSKYTPSMEEDTADTKRKSFSPLSPTCSILPELSPINLPLDESTQATTDFFQQPPVIGLGILENKFKGIRDLEQQDQNYKNTSGRRKEGFLFATSKPSKSHHHSTTPSFDMTSAVNWHKYWCVLSGGQLHEYSNWKKHLESHIEPINLRFATVREARNADRRFCFEVITPNFRRMYQATSSEELSSWIATINNAISSLLNGMSSSINLKENTSPTPSSSLSPHATNWKNQARSLSGALSGLAAAKDKYLLKKRHHTRKEIGYISSPTSATPYPSQQTRANTNSDLLVLLRKDLSNTICADCSAKNPEWCSLNLGILICIECSGIHRSLGTHISKVRSLTLDSASFTPDIVQLLLSIGNAKSNTIWEFDTFTSHKKPIPTDTRDIKLKYIQLKYVDRVFVSKQETQNAMDILYYAIAQDNIPKALYAIALGANINQPFTSHTPIIPLLPTADSVLKLPMLDIAGNEYLDRTVEINLGKNNTAATYSQKDFIVRYALHFALLHHPSQEEEEEEEEEEEDEDGSGLPQRPANSIAIDNFQDDSCSSSSSSTSTSCSSSSSSSVATRRRVFPMAEFLFQNGADVFIIDSATGRLLADLVGLGHLVDNEAIDYLNMKNSLRGQTTIVRTHIIPPPV